MLRPQVFAEGVGTGVSLILLVAAAASLIFSRHRPVTTAIRRHSEDARTGRSLSTNRLPDNYLDVCRSAGL